MKIVVIENSFELFFFSYSYFMNYKFYVCCDKEMKLEVYSCSLISSSVAY